MRFPNSTEECIYFTRRADDKMKIIAWVFKKQCPKCKKGLMEKPRDPKTGKAKIRSTEYVCNNCGYSEEKKAHEESLTVNVQYKCPHCGNEGETTTAYKRKAFEGIPSFVFECQKCHKKIAITKKMKEKKGSADEPDEE
jgi:DNA-directed RNA polymerase subunit M/transcription elongation factor TFIIS